MYWRLYNKDSDTGYFIKSDIKYPENLPKLHNDWPFLPKRMYVVYIRPVKQALNLKLVMQKVIE